MSSQAVATIEPEAAPIPGAVLLVAELIAAHNAIRKRYGLKPLSKVSTLQKACEGHAIEMAARSVMSHHGANGSSPFQRMTRAGYRWAWAGENVAWNYQSVAAVMDGWMRSPGHRSNILSSNFTNIGVACVYSTRGEPYWGADFGSPAAKGRESPPDLHMIAEQSMDAASASSVRMEGAEP